MAAHLLPRDYEARAMGAEDRIRRVVEVVLRFVAHDGDDFFGVVAWAVAVQTQVQLSPAPRVAHHVHGVAAHGGGRGRSGQGGGLAVRGGLWRVEAAAHLLNVVHGAAHVFRRELQPEGIPRFEKLRFVDLSCHHQALPHGTVRRLTEVAALGVLQMRAARDKCELHIRQR